MNRRFTALCVLCALGAALLIGVPLRGRWLDRAVSEWVSRRSGHHLEFSQTSLVIAARTATFGSARLTDANGRLTASAVEGKVRLSGWSCERGSLTMRELRLDSGVLWKTLATAAPAGVLPETPQIRFGPVRIDRVRRQDRTTLHLSEIRSDDFRLVGGWQWERGRTRKAHLRVAVSGRVGSSIPKALAKRLRPRRDGFLEWRLVFFGNSLEVDGVSGPIVKARWRSFSSAHRAS